MSRDTMAVDTEQSLSRRKPPVCQIVPPPPPTRAEDGKKAGGLLDEQKGVAWQTARSMCQIRVLTPRSVEARQ